MGSKKHSANSPQTLQFVFLQGTKRWARCFTRFKIPCFPWLPTAVYCAVEISAVLRNHRRPNISVANEWIFVSFCTKKIVSRSYYVMQQDKTRFSTSEAGWLFAYTSVRTVAIVSILQMLHNSNTIKCRV